MSSRARVSRLSPLDIQIRVVEGAGLARVARMEIPALVPSPMHNSPDQRSRWRAKRERRTRICTFNYLLRTAAPLKLLCPA